MPFGQLNGQLPHGLYPQSQFGMGYPRQTGLFHRCCPRVIGWRVIGWRVIGWLVIGTLYHTPFRGLYATEVL
jgi:hypothetical protein